MPSPPPLSAFCPQGSRLKDTPMPPEGISAGWGRGFLMPSGIQAQAPPRNSVSLTVHHAGFNAGSGQTLLSESRPGPPTRPTHTGHLVDRPHHGPRPREARLHWTLPPAASPVPGYRRPWESGKGADEGGKQPDPHDPGVPAPPSPDRKTRGQSFSKEKRRQQNCPCAHPPPFFPSQPPDAPRGRMGGGPPAESFLPTPIPPLPHSPPAPIPPLPHSPPASLEARSSAQATLRFAVWGRGPIRPP